MTPERIAEMNARVEQVKRWKAHGGGVTPTESVLCDYVTELLAEHARQAEANRQLVALCQSSNRVAADALNAPSTAEAEAR